MSLAYAYDESSEAGTSVASSSRTRTSMTTTVSTGTESTIKQRVSAPTTVNCKTYKWSTLAQLNSILKLSSEKLENNKLGDNFIAFEGVEGDAFEDIQTKRDSNSLECTCRLDYDSSTNILIIRIPTGYHELGHTLLCNQVFYRVREMGCEEELLPTGAKTMRIRRDQERSSKEGDSTIRPSSRSRDEYPSLVIEAGYSESLGNLRADAAKWFKMSSGKVRIVIVCSIILEKKEITLKKWIPVDAGQTRSGTTLIPTCVQKLVITKRDQRDGRVDGEYVNLRRPTAKGHFYVEGAPLLIEFSQLFDRVPNQRNELEKDLNIDAESLALYCYQVFQG